MIVRAPLKPLYEMAHILENFPKYIPDLKNLRVIERAPAGNFMRAEWHAQMKFLGAVRSLIWIQDDTWKDENFTCCFRLYKSKDMKSLQGEWKFTPHPKGTEMVFDVAFRVRHPLMTPMIHRLLDQVMRKNNEHMLAGLKRDAEQKFWEQW